jgi:signal transduction histidine kinase
MIFGDPDLLRRLFENFVSNAVQALTEKNGKGEVIVTDKDGKVLVQVRDTGHGIPPERLSGLFDEFTTTKGRGLGLGLAIAKKIVQLHGGEISVTSVVEKGTTFFITLPRE